MPSASPVPINVAVVGLGTIGRAVAAAVAADNEMRLAGLVDLDPKKIGRMLSELGVASDNAAVVIDDVERLDAIDVAIVCTGPRLDRVAPTLRQLMMKKAHIVSSCEELAWPWLRLPHLADALTNEARKAGVAIVGAGVNPGLALDTMPLLLASSVSNVKKVKGTRVVDLRTVRPSVLRQSGVTQTAVQFRALLKQNLVGHVGLGESVVLIAQGLGRHPMRGDVRTSVATVLAEANIDSALGRIDAGQVCGIRQTAGWQGDGIEIELELHMCLTNADPRDEVQITGERTATLLVPGGTPDDATAAVLVNVARLLPRVPPGLRTMLDLPVVGSR
ncbi:MAG TPA: Gfo/Idh/MocA family oxidoreductase [Tepidisphaeraceae bacterium]|jgi:4-hydroxy-tetrahydrodipicolinate reductase